MVKKGNDQTYVKIFMDAMTHRHLRILSAIDGRTMSDYVDALIEERWKRSPVGRAEMSRDSQPYYDTDGVYHDDRGGVR